MPTGPNLRSWLAPFLFFLSNWLSMAGVFLVTGSGILWFFLLPQLWRHETQNPYIGILLFVGLPAAFIGGLIMIPIGIFLQRRRNARRDDSRVIDFNRPEIRRFLIFLGVATMVNLVIASQLTYTTVNYMEGASFCGATCHVMKPEFTAYQHAPHRNVECVKCHAGPGATGFVASKMAGVQQLIEVTFNTYPRPIPAPIRHQLTSAETCQNCHSSRQIVGDRLRVIPKFAEDDTNTRTDSVLLMHVGSGNGYTGIHGAHMGPGITIRFASADSERQKIPWVQYERAGAGNTDFVIQGASVGQPQGSMRVMDCMDCHNRAAHSYELPERALDKAMADGTIWPGLPQAKKQGLAILKVAYSSQEDGTAKIPQAFQSFYRQKYPDVYASHQKELLSAASELAAIYSRNVFPEMKVTWGVYQNNLGHTDSTGCFRCHDDLHASRDGNKIGQDCSTCHNMIAMDEASPKILGDLGIVTK